MRYVKIATDRSTESGRVLTAVGMVRYQSRCTVARQIDWHISIRKSCQSNTIGTSSVHCDARRQTDIPRITQYDHYKHVHGQFMGEGGVYALVVVVGVKQHTKGNKTQ
jgi:hypothetical protein